MGAQHRDRSLGDGVYFTQSDYVGFGVRIVVLLIDGLTLAGLYYLTDVAWSYVDDRFESRFLTA